MIGLRIGCGWLCGPACFTRGYLFHARISVTAPRRDGAVLALPCIAPDCERTLQWVAQATFARSFDRGATPIRT